ncbi:MAG: nucleotidyltransferase domain-containing protein [Alphaproteobacteria bacterium]|nr:nucleotidyltransferase domain-containing protein [Alphaproteobacteria bacterium]
MPGAAASRLKSYRRSVEGALPNFEKLILFGSRARGQAGPDSDYDVAVVVRHLTDRRRVRRMLSDLAYEHVLDGFYIRPIPIPSGDLEMGVRRPTELVEDIVCDGAEVT